MNGAFGYVIILMCAPGKGQFMQIRNMPAQERPQEKLLFSGVSGLSNAELLALVIRTGTSEKSSIQLAEDMIAYAFTHTGGLGRAEAKDLMNIEGVGAAKACSVVAAFELAKRFMAGEVRDSGARLQSVSDVAGLLMEEMMYERREIFMALFLNTKLQIESKSVISIGSLDAAPVHPREVFGPAVRRGAAAVLVAHNHPSGDPEPSPEDYAITERLTAASRIIGIRLVDHVIIGKGSFVSMRSEGAIKD